MKTKFSSHFMRAAMRNRRVISFWTFRFSCPCRCLVRSIAIIIKELFTSFDVFFGENSHSVVTSYQHNLQNIVLYCHETDIKRLCIVVIAIISQQKGIKETRITNLDSNAKLVVYFIFVDICYNGLINNRSITEHRYGILKTFRKKGIGWFI